MTARLSPQRETEIRERAESAHLTPGPWRLEYEQCDCSDGYCHHGAYVAAVATPEPTPVAAERLARAGEEPRDYDFSRTDMGDFSAADWELMAHARADVPALLAELAAVRAERDKARAQLAKVAAHVEQRAEFITAINGCHNDADYWRWQGQAEARRQLAEELGLPVAWPAKDEEAAR
jgi:hypothetical protein